MNGTPLWVSLFFASPISDTKGLIFKTLLITAFSYTYGDCDDYLLVPMNAPENEDYFYKFDP